MRLGPAGGIPNASRTPCTTSVGTVTASSSGRRLGAGGRAARGLQREGEAEHPDGAGRLCRAARDAGARGPAAGDQRQPAQLALEQVVDDRRPGGIELVCRCRRTSPRDAIGLLDERDADPHRERRIRGRNQVPGGHAPARTMTKHERGSGFFGGMQVRVRRAVRRVEFENRHVSSA